MCTCVSGVLCVLVCHCLMCSFVTPCVKFVMGSCVSLHLMCYVQLVCVPVSIVLHVVLCSLLGML